MNAILRYGAIIPVHEVSSKLGCKLLSFDITGFWRQDVGLGCVIKPKMLKIKNVPIGCGSIGIDEQKTLKNYILSFKIQPALSAYIIQRKFSKIQRKNPIFNKLRF